MPIPRATTAACEVMPPCAVRIALRLDHPVDVVGRRLPADEDHRLARLAALLGGVGVEDDLRRTAAPGDAFRPRAATSNSARRVDHRMQQLVELLRVDARDRLLAGDQPLAAMSTAALIAAAAVRFAERVCRR